MTKTEEELLTELRSTWCSHENIAKTAYAAWEAEGRPNGEDARFWLQAERQLNYMVETTVFESASPEVRAEIDARYGMVGVWSGGI